MYASLTHDMHSEIFLNHFTKRNILTIKLLLQYQYLVHPKKIVKQRRAFLTTTNKNIYLYFDGTLIGSLHILFRLSYSRRKETLHNISIQKKKCLSIHAYNCSSSSQQSVLSPENGIIPELCSQFMEQGCTVIRLTMLYMVPESHWVFRHSIQLCTVLPLTLKHSAIYGP